MIAVLVLNWNNAADTLECLKSIANSNHPNYCIYLIDNGSTDGSPDLIRAAFPMVNWIQNESNLGFAEGNNRGIIKAIDDGAKYVFLLNNDAIIRQDTLSLLEEAANRWPNAAVLGPKIYAYDQPTRIWYAGASYEEKIARFIHRDAGLDESAAPKHPEEPTGYVCGCAFFARADVIKKTGLMDKRYFLNWEEIDWCSRFAALGHEMIYVPSAKVWHKIGSSFTDGKRGPSWHYYFWRNRLLWVEKFVPLKQRIRLFFTVLIPEIKQLWEKRKEFEMRSIVFASFRGIFHYIIRNFGKGPDFFTRKVD